MIEEEQSIKKIFGNQCEYIGRPASDLVKQGYRIIGSFNINDNEQVNWALNNISHNKKIGVALADGDLNNKMKGVYYVMQKPHPDLRKE